jgi:hypothetical protein
MHARNFAAVGLALAGALELDGALLHAAAVKAVIATTEATFRFLPTTPPVAVPTYNRLAGAPAAGHGKG